MIVASRSGTSISDKEVIFAPQRRQAKNHRNSMSYWTKISRGGSGLNFLHASITYEYINFVFILTFNCFLDMSEVPRGRGYGNFVWNCKLDNAARKLSIRNKFGEIE